MKNKDPGSRSKRIGDKRCPGSAAMSHSDSDCHGLSEALESLMSPASCACGLWLLVLNVPQQGL